MCVFVDKKIFEPYFSDRLTFFNIRSRTCRQIYRLILPLLSQEMLSPSSESRIFLFNAHLALYVRMDDTNSHTNALVAKYGHSFSNLELISEVRALTVAVQTRQQAESL